MRYLGLALFAEGPSDHRFLRPLLRRLCEELCASLGASPTEVGEVLELHSPPELRDADRATRVLGAARDACGSWHILFVHTDGGGDPKAARAQRVERGCRRIEAELSNGYRDTVAVVPVRETEAWALADGEALRGVFGTSLDDRAMDLPGSGPEVESVLDPKEHLNRVYLATRGQRRRRPRISASRLLEPIGESVALDALRRVAAFRDLDEELKDALRRLRFIRG